MIAIKQVTGMAYDDKTKKMQIKKLIVRVIHDRAGSTISIEDGKTMLSVPMEPIEDMFKKGKRQ